MTASMTPDEALGIVPQLAGRRYRWSPLPGGLTNRNYKVTTAERSYVLRLDAGHTADFALDRETELKARQRASAAGLCAPVVFSDIGRGILLSEYLDGDVWSAADLDDRKKLAALAALIRSVHRLPLLDSRFDPLKVANVYAESLPAPFARRCIEIVESTPTVETYRCCHNDIVAENVVAGSGLVLLDWEYACDNDPFFDLASVIGYHDLDAAQSEMLLGAYAGGADAEKRENLRIQIRLFDAIQWLWFSVRQRTSPRPQFAARLERLRRRLQ